MYTDSIQHTDDSVIMIYENYGFTLEYTMKNAFKMTATGRGEVNFAEVRRQWIKPFAEAVEGLDFLHKQGLVCRSFNGTSIIVRQGEDGLEGRLVALFVYEQARQYDSPIDCESALYFGTDHYH